MVNCSLTLGYFPVVWKAVLADPRLKKLCQSASLSNLRPVMDSVDLWTLWTCGLHGPVDLWTCGLRGLVDSVDLWTCGRVGSMDL